MLLAFTRSASRRALPASWAKICPYMRVFRDMELVEQIGSGMSRILKAYDRSIFELSPSFTVVTFPLGNKDFQPFRLYRESSECVRRGHAPRHLRHFAV